MADNTMKTLRNEVFYQVFVRNYKGGTFRAVTEDLDRIQSLGVNWIYLLPVHPTGEVHRKGSLGSPYAIKDYRAVDPLLGRKVTRREYRKLVEHALDKGLKNGFIQEGETAMESFIPLFNGEGVLAR